MGLAFYHQLGQITKTLDKAKECLMVLHQKDSKSEIVKEKECEIKQHETDFQKVCSGKEEYQNVLQKISKTVHPFTLKESNQQTSENVEKALMEKAQELKEIAARHAISDSRCVLDKFKRQIKDIASNVEAWWLWTTESLATYELDIELQDWLLNKLLPVFYWHRQMERTQNPKLKMSYKKAWEQALKRWQTDSLTLNLPSSEMERWRGWAKWMVGKFQRASSAVEGRNGWLSQMYHNGRGLTSQRLKALTVIHNFDMKRSDGTTAAERLFEVQFPDLFEWVIDRMGELPLSRSGRKRTVCNPLIIQTVPP